MRARFLSCLALLTLPSIASAETIPTGKLPDAARPTAYRLDLTIVPEKDRFSGHTEIDVTVTRPTTTLYLHGRDLKVSKVTAKAGGKLLTATYAQVDPLGVARLTFPTALPAGKATLSFDYDAAFGDSASGLYHVKVGNDWYSWTQFESIDARSAFPSFDEPGYKTPFTVSLTTAPGLKTVSNAPEVGTVPAGDLVKHRFQPTRPLPTYLMAFVVGPFLTADGHVPPSPERKAPLPLRVVATKEQAGKLDYAAQESGRIVTLLEKYFGQPFPFPKLDQIASPIMGGAMENAGADIYEDGLILLDRGATTRQKQNFGMVVAHELSHQWFGDYVTPAWWDDIWLNESFANWMGYRIGNEWRPELNIGVGAIDEALQAMDTDALVAGRPIHQPIRTNGEIDSAFDSITYGKGGQVVAMIAAYLGDAKFQQGVRLHMARHPYGNATSEQFFGALADAAKDKRVLAAMKSFVDQQGVPVVRFARSGEGYTVTQARYSFYGANAAPETWTIPLCIRRGSERSCSLLDGQSAQMTIPGSGAIVPNAGGTGYYRFDLDQQDWQTLIAEAPRLPAGEALAVNDSLWASFDAGRAPAADLVAELRTMAGNPDSNAAVDAGLRFADLARRGIMPPSALDDYRRLQAEVYGPRLTSLGFAPAAGTYENDDPDRQKLRQDLVALLATEARDPAIRSKLKDAARAYLGGDTKAVDQAFLGTALQVAVDDGDPAFAKDLATRALASEDAVFRRAALTAVGRSGKPDLGSWILNDFRDKRLRTSERLTLFGGLVRQPQTRDAAVNWLYANYDAFAKDAGIFTASTLPNYAQYQCSLESADQVERQLGPKVKAAGRGELDFQRTLETIRNCGKIRDARGADIAAALSAAK